MSARGGRALLPLAALLMAHAARAATAYVSDDLILGVYAEQDGQGQRLATLHSGAIVETLASGGEFTQVRLPDGRIGWVRSTYLTTRVPAQVRVKQLEEELEASRATTPELAAAAGRTELEGLKRELAERDAALAAARSPVAARPKRTPLGWIAATAVAAALGFALGYATLARRIRQKFGGLKIY